ncbi:MBL fold metallo-hydrolase [Saccharopolyspora sp. NPDC000359]|uniref:MBL fold metallo-hydrolase n=1 Tax=Saccharopolyspora sp. NPDC000359 TaxID=3154251 RepID=UPI003324A4B0
MVTSFPANQEAAARKAFGLFNPDQGLRIFSRDQSSGYEPIVVEAAPRTWYIQPSMVNVGLFETDEGLLLVDTGCAGDGPALVEAVRSVSDKPLHTVVFTHGHSDHAFGLWAFLEQGETPQVVAHENVAAHFERYMKTSGLQALINGQLPGPDGKRWAQDPEDFVWPTQVFRDELELTIGGERFVLRHGKGETDDATWVWAPDRGVVAAGDLVTGYLPNAGNPRKVQRYAEEWADAAEEMADLRPSVIIPGHGDLVTGAAAIEDELRTLAKYLRHIVDHALRGLNSGVLADDIVESLAVPDELANHPRLVAVYDKPQFICRNVIRRYAGWWDGYPANLLPAPRAQQCAEIAGLAGGVGALVDRAWELADVDLRLACHLAEWAFLADRGDEHAQDAYQRILERRADEEPALMAQIGLRASGQWVEAARSAARE